MAAKAGVTYISIFIGGLDDFGKDRIGVLRDSIHVLRTYQYPSSVLGCTYQTTPYYVYDENRIIGESMEEQICQISLFIIISDYWN